MALALKDRTRLLSYLFLAIAILFTVTGELLLKHGMNRHGVLELAPATLLPTLFRVFTNPFVLLGFALVFTAAIFWLSVISRIELSIAYPMLSTGYILVLLASWLFLGEHITWMRLLGVLVIIGGVSLVFRSGQ